MVVVFALSPLVVALVMLGVYRCSPVETGAAMLLVVMVCTALFPAFHLSPYRVAIALGTGVTPSLVLVGVLLPALVFYHVQRATGTVRVLTQVISQVTPNRDLQLLLLVFGVGPCIESLCGMGVGALVVLPLLAEQEQKNFKIVSLSLLTQLVAPWGGLAYSTALASVQTHLDASMVGAHTALLLFPLSLVAALLALYLGGGKDSVLQHWRLALLSASLLMGGAWFFSQMIGPDIAGILSSLLVIAMMTCVNTVHCYLQKTARPQRSCVSPLLLKVLAPYLVLGCGLLLVRLYQPLRNWSQAQFVLTWKALGLSFPVVASPTFWLLLASLTTLLLFRPEKRILSSALSTARRQFVSIIGPVLLFLCVASLMTSSGMIAAIGSAIAPMGKNYVWIVPAIAGVGGWLTSSSTGGNALCNPLQQAISIRVGLPLAWIVPAQTASSAIAVAISPMRLTMIHSALGRGPAVNVNSEIGLVVIWSMIVLAVCLVWFIGGSPLFLFLLLLVTHVPFFLWYWMRMRSHKRHEYVKSHTPSMSA